MPGARLAHPRDQEVAEAGFQPRVLPFDHSELESGSEGLDEGLVERLDEYCRDRPQWFTYPALQRRMEQAAEG